MKSTVYRNTRFTIIVVVLLSLGVACKQTDESVATRPPPPATDKGDPEQAITDCDQAIAPDSQDAQAYYDRGVMCAKSGDLERAIRDFDQAIELNPDYGAAYHDRGNAYGALGDLEGAIRDHDKAIELAPDNPQAYYSRGLDYANAGDPEQAIRDFTKAIELNPDHAAAYFDRGLSFYESGDLDRAIADLNKTIEIDASNAFAYFVRGVAYTQVGEREKAISDVERALELGLEPSHEQNAEALLEELRGSSQSFDGTYRGTTSQGQEFELVVEGNGIRSVLVGFDIPGCESYSPMSLYYGQPKSFITGNGLSLTDSGLIITGTFSSSTSASGTMEIKPVFCEGSVQVTWNASK
jgi:tetratricopeptide (TPR) repeat protein